MNDNVTLFCAKINIFDCIRRYVRGARAITTAVKSILKNFKHKLRKLKNNHEIKIVFYNVPGWSSVSACLHAGIGFMEVINFCVNTNIS